MFFDALPPYSATQLSEAVVAIGALGGAATGLVDGLKVFWGGPSRAGMGFIKNLIHRFLPASQPDSGLAVEDIIDTLRANWMNGMNAPDQKAIAKSFLKLHFNTTTAATYAKETGVDPDLLATIATKVPSGTPLTDAETDAYGRFDLALSAVVDKAYQRGDQLYRNFTKVLALGFAVALAYLGTYSLGLSATWRWQPLVIGLIATPLAPMAKDVASAITAAAQAVQSVKR